MNKSFKIGDVVILTNKNYIPTSAYPIVGSSEACNGTVRGIKKDTNLIVVEWENGHVRNFNANDLSLVTSINCKSIW